MKVDGTRLRVLRIRMGLTQQGLAIRADVARETIARAERSQLARADTVRRIATVLGVDVSELLLDEPRFVTPRRKTPQGTLVNAERAQWLNFVNELVSNPHALSTITPNQFEELIAAAYVTAGFDEVILTTPVDDGGVDVIAVKEGDGTPNNLRILVQCKAYTSGRLVGPDDVRAMLGVLQANPNASKCIIATTSDFQPSVFKSDEFKRFIPHRLELLNGKQLVRWLKGIEHQEERHEGEVGPAQLVIAYDSRFVSPSEYAELVRALGDVIRAEGGAGLVHLRREGFDLVKSEEPAPT